MKEQTKIIEECTEHLKELGEILTNYKIDEYFFRNQVYGKLGMVFSHGLEIDGNTPFTIYRSRKANEITKEDDLKKTSTFSYIPLEITNGKFPHIGRLNYTGQSVFYGSFKAYINFKEIDKNIQPGALIYTSLWKISKNAKINCYSIFSSEKLKDCTDGISKLIKGNSNFTDSALDSYLRVLGYETLRNDFADDRKYFISSIVGNHILEYRSSFKENKPLYDAIVYPSVAYGKGSDLDQNIAMLPKTVDSSLEFYCVIKGELLEDFRLRPLLIGRVEDSIIEWYKIEMITDLSDFHVKGVIRNGKRELFESSTDYEIFQSYFKLFEEKVICEKGFEIQRMLAERIKQCQFVGSIENINVDFKESNPIPILFEIPLEKEYFKNFKGFEGVVIMIDGNIKYSHINSSEALSYTTLK